jgi:hypothetical protein
MKKARGRIDVNLEELDRVLDGAREAPLSESESRQTQRHAARSGGAAGAGTQYGEDQ